MEHEREGVTEPNLLEVWSERLHVCTASSLLKGCSPSGLGWTSPELL